MRAWSHDLQISWSPEFSFFERRAGMLRRFEDEGSLVAFRWGETEVSVQLADAEFLDVTSTGAHLRVMSPNANLERARSALETAMSMIEPGLVVVSRVLAQFIIPLDHDYDEARNRSLDKFIRPVMPGAGAEDYAILVTGRSRGSTRVPFVCEFGVIAESEAEDRVRRRAGRMSEAMGLRPPRGATEDVQYPPCAFFFDWGWMPGIQIGSHSEVQEIFGVCDELVEEGANLAAEVQSASGLVTIEEEIG